jgi:hypothetical protein
VTTRRYTRTDVNGVRWRMEGGRPVSEIADRVNDLADEARTRVGSPYSPSVSESPSPSPTPSPSESLSLSPTDSFSVSPSTTPSPSCWLSGSDEIPEEEWRAQRNIVPSAAMPPTEREVARAVERLARQTRAQEAIARARGLLVEVIGEAAVRELEDGGYYVLPSKKWPGTEYHIPKTGYIRVVRDGLWQEACLVSSDSSLPWADVVLSRIKMIQLKEEIVQQKANRQGASKNKILDAIVRTLTGER